MKIPHNTSHPKDKQSKTVGIIPDHLFLSSFFHVRFLCTIWATGGSVVQNPLANAGGTDSNP